MIVLHGDSIAISCSYGRKNGSHEPPLLLFRVSPLLFQGNGIIYDERMGWEASKRSDIFSLLGFLNLGAETIHNLTELGDVLEVAVD